MKVKKWKYLLMPLFLFGITLAGPTISVNAMEAGYCDLTLDGGQWDGTHYYNADNVMVRDVFFYDGTNTYFLQYDGTPMKDRFTYHPDGEHLIYFDEEGHEVFNNFHHIKTSVSGDAVDDLCFFDVYGYLYKNVITYDQTGTRIYYANSNGVMEQNGFFDISTAALNYDALAAGKLHGYAGEDGTVEGFYEDYQDYLVRKNISCKIWMPVQADVYRYENGGKVLDRTEDFTAYYSSNAEKAFENVFYTGGTKIYSNGGWESIADKTVYNPAADETLSANGFHYENNVVVLNDLDYNDGDLLTTNTYPWDSEPVVTYELQDENNGTRKVTTPYSYTEYAIKDGRETLTAQYGRFQSLWSAPFVFYKQVEMDGKVIGKKYIKFYSGEYGPYVLVATKGEMPFGIQGNVGEQRRVTFTRYDADWISYSVDETGEDTHLKYDDNRNEQWTNPEEIVVTYECRDLVDCLE